VTQRRPSTVLALVVGQALLLAGALLDVGWSKTAHAQETVVIENFDGQENLFGFPRTTAYARQGTGAGRWEAAKGNGRFNIPTSELKISDWNGKTLSFWVFSEVANNDTVVLNLWSDDPVTADLDYFFLPIRLDFGGWKQFRVCEADLGRRVGIAPNTRPLGWDRMTSMQFSGTYWMDETGAPPKKNTVLLIDAMQVEPTTPADIAAARAAPAAANPASPPPPPAGDRTVSLVLGRTLRRSGHRFTYYTVSSRGPGTGPPLRVRPGERVVVPLTNGTQSIRVVNETRGVLAAYPAVNYLNGEIVPIEAPHFKRVKAMTARITDVDGQPLRSPALVTLTEATGRTIRQALTGRENGVATFPDVLMGPATMAVTPSAPGEDAPTVKRIEVTAGRRGRPAEAVVALPGLVAATAASSSAPTDGPSVAGAGRALVVAAALGLCCVALGLLATRALRSGRWRPTLVALPGEAAGRKDGANALPSPRSSSGDVRIPAPEDISLAMTTHMVATPDAGAAASGRRAVPRPAARRGPPTTAESEANACSPNPHDADARPDL